MNFDGMAREIPEFCVRGATSNCGCWWSSRMAFPLSSRLTRGAQTWRPFSSLTGEVRLPESRPTTLPSTSSTGPPLFPGLDTRDSIILSDFDGDACSLEGIE
jgi:hypothetical protein